MPRSNKSEFNGTKPARRTSSRRRLAAIALPAALLLMPLLALKLYIWKYPMRWGNTDIVHYVWTRNCICAHRKNYSVVTLGASTQNAAFVPELLSENVLDLATRSCSPSTIYYVFKEYLSHSDAPETVYMGFYGTCFRETHGLCPGGMTAGLFNPKDEAEYLLNIIQFKDSPQYYPKSKYWGYKHYLRHRLANFSTYWPYLRNSGFSGRIADNTTVLQKQWSHRGTEVTRTIFEWAPSGITIWDYRNNAYARNNWRHFTVSPLQDFYYKKILDLCKERGIFIRIQVLPIPLENYGPGYWDEFRAYHEEALAGYDSWTLDTSPELASATTGGYSIGDFADDHHFNNHGSLKFCRMIRERYPEDFAEGAVMPVSDNTLAGLEDYLCMENQADKILQWIQGTGRAEGGVPLSALLVTRNGHTLEEDQNLAAVLREEYPAYAEGLVAWGKGDSACYFSGEASASISGEAPAALSCDGGAASLSFSDGAVSLSAFDDGRNFRARLYTTEDGQPRTKELSVPDGADLYAIVLNTRTGRLVTCKSFRFTGWSYRLL